MHNDQKDKLCNHLEVSNRTNQFQNPSRDRSGQPVVGADTRTGQDGRKKSRSEEIDVNSFHEESVSSERTERPVVETSVIQARSSEESKDSNVETAHERTRRIVNETNTENVPVSCQHVLVMKAKHSTLEIKHFVKERGDPLSTMTIHVMSKQC